MSESEDKALRLQPEVEEAEENQTSKKEQLHQQLLQVIEELKQKI